MSELRIASLVPSATDLVAALGLGEHLVGVSHECDHPIAEGKPVLTRSAVFESDEPPPSPRDIDDRVSRAAREGEPLYVTDRERLRALEPTLVIAQGICDVCAVTPEQARAGLPEGCRLLELQAGSVDGLYADLQRLGEAASRPQPAQHVIEELRARIEHVHERVANRQRPNVIALEWSDPPYVGGHWVPEMVFLAGGEHALRSPGERSVRVKHATIRDADPDMLVFMPCGYDFDRALDEAERSLSRWDLRAVRESRLWVTDANALFSRCTPQSVGRGIEVLAGMFHPELFDPPEAGEARRVSPAR